MTPDARADLIARLREGVCVPCKGCNATALEAAAALEAMQREIAGLQAELADTKVTADGRFRMIREKQFQLDVIGAERDTLRGHLLEREKELRSADKELKAAWAERDAHADQLGRLKAMERAVYSVLWLPETGAGRWKVLEAIVPRRREGVDKNVSC